MSGTTAWYEIRLKDNLSSGIKNAEKGVDNFDRKINNLNNDTNNFGNSFKNIFAGNLIANFASNAASQIKSLAYEVINVTREFTNLQDAIKFASGKDAAYNIQFLNNTVDKLGLDLQATYEGFKTFEGALMGTSLEGDKGRDIFTAVSEAASVMKLSPEQTKGTFLALGQMVSKGTVAAEELRGQLGERMPGAFQIFSRALGVSTSKLGDMLKKGEVIAEYALPKFADELRKTFSPGVADAQKSFNANMNRFDNWILKLKIDLGNQLIPTLNELVTTIPKIDFSPWIDPLSDIWTNLKGISTSLGEIFEGMTGIGANDFITKLKELSKELLFIGNTFTALFQYAANKANSALTGRVGPQLSADELMMQFGLKPSDASPTWEDLLKNSLEKAGQSLSQANTTDFSFAPAPFQQQKKKKNKILDNGGGTDIGAEKISSATRNITLNIDKLVGEITFESSIENTTQQTIEAVKRVLLTAVNDVNLVAN